MPDAYIVSAVRTPIGKFLGALADISAPKLGAVAIREAVKRTRVDADQIDEVLMGNVLQAGVGQAPARQAAIHAGLPPKVPAVTINKVCGSGLKTVMIGATSIRAGDADVIVAGGMESMSNAPYLLPGARRGVRLGHAELVDHMILDGLWDPYGDIHMGETAELVAERYKISRREMDEYSVRSHRRALAASFADEIVPVEVREKKETRLVEKDEGPRADCTLENLAKLKPAFRPQGGLVTAGNSSTISDGAAAVVLMSERKLKETGAKPLARILGYAAGGVEPKWVMMAPLEAVKNLSARTGLKARDVDLVEINEAFAVQCCALTRELALDPEKLNVDGGAVALGHPIGCSGTRVLVTLIHALHRRKLRRGIAALCLGGGNGVAMAVEAIA